MVEAGQGSSQEKPPFQRAAPVAGLPADQHPFGRTILGRENRMDELRQTLGHRELP